MHFDFVRQFNLTNLILLLKSRKIKKSVKTMEYAFVQYFKCILNVVNITIISTICVYIRQFYIITNFFFASAKTLKVILSAFYSFFSPLTKEFFQYHLTN